MALREPGSGSQLELRWITGGPVTGAATSTGSRTGAGTQTLAPVLGGYA